MKLTLFGATGLFGRELLSQTLEAGHDITVLLRSPEKLSAEMRARANPRGYPYGKSNPTKTRIPAARIASRLREPLPLPTAESMDSSVVRDRTDHLSSTRRRSRYCPSPSWGGWQRSNRP
jgi:hypothetical protein